MWACNTSLCDVMGVSTRQVSPNKRVVQKIDDRAHAQVHKVTQTCNCWKVYFTPVCQSQVGMGECMHKKRHGN